MLHSIKPYKYCSKVNEILKNKLKIIYKKYSYAKIKYN